MHGVQRIIFNTSPVLSPFKYEKTGQKWLLLRNWFFVAEGGVFVKKNLLVAKRYASFIFQNPAGQRQKVALISSGAMDARDGFIILVVNGQVRMSGRMA